MRQVIVALLLLLLILMGGDATRWHNAAVVALHPEQPEVHGQRDAASYKRPDNYSQTPDLIFPSLTVVLGALTLGVLSFQAWIFKRQHGIMVEQAKISARQVDIAERALVSAEQAFVMATSFNSAGTVAANGFIQEWQFMPRWTNSGSTPARHVLMHSSVFVSKSGLPPNFDYPDQLDRDETREEHMLTIGPREERMNNPKSVSLTDLSESFCGRTRVFLYGWIEYNDVFPETKRHRTEFCEEIVVKADPIVRAEHTFMFLSCGLHNGTEDECYRKPGEVARQVPFGDPVWPPCHDTHPVRPGR